MCKGMQCYVLSVLAALVMVLGGGVVHLMAWWPNVVDWEIFEGTEVSRWTRYESKRHDLRFYFSQWIFYIWVIMYVLQVFMIIYGLELVCRKTRAGDLYHQVPVIPSAVFILTMLASAGILGWLALFTSSEYFSYAPLVLLASTFCFYVALAVTVRSLKQYLPVLYSVNANRFIWEIRLLVHNTLGVAASWTTVVLFYNVVIVLEEGGILPEKTDGYVFLSLLGAYTIIWFAVDLSLARRYLANLLTPYMVFIVTLVQVLLKSGLEFNYYFIYSVVLLGVTAILFLVRLAMAIGMSNRRGKI